MLEWMEFDIEQISSLQVDNEVTDATNPKIDLDSAVIQLVAKAIRNRTGLDENRSIGAAEEVFYTVLKNLRRRTPS